MNEKPIDVEAVPESQAIAVRPSMAVAQAMSVDDIVAQVTLIQDVMKRVMHEGEHFGAIPGCGEKKTLLQPGAQKLCMTFKLAPEYVIQEVNLDRGHKEYRVICTLKTINSGTFVGQGVGCCSSMESKYRWRKAERKCPKCGHKTIIAGKEEYGGGWLCWKKKGGCGAKFVETDASITSQPGGDVENENPADCFNTVLKIAKKRAFVDATITATAASDIFTQDIGDAEADGEPQEAHSAPEPPPRPVTPPPPQKPAPAPAAPRHATPATRDWMLKELSASRGEANYYAVTEFFRKCDKGVLMPTETVDDLPLQWVAIDRKQLALLRTALRDFDNGDQAHMPYGPNPTGAPAPKSQGQSPSTGQTAPSTPTSSPGSSTAPSTLTRTPTQTPTGGTAKPGETAKPIEVPRDPNPDPNSPDAPWRAFPMPFGNMAGTPLARLDKNYLFGLWANFKVELTWKGTDGKIHQTKPERTAIDKKLREMLDEAGKHYEFRKKD